MILHGVESAAGERTVKVLKSAPSGGYQIVHFVLKELSCTICNREIALQDAIRGTTCSADGKLDFVHRSCLPDGHDLDVCILCSDDNCRAVSGFCQTGNLCRRRDCRNNLGYNYSIFVHSYDAHGNRIIGDGAVEADYFPTCSKCIVPQINIEMERLFPQSDVSATLNILFEDAHERLYNAFHCTRCFVTCLL